MEKMRTDQIKKLIGFINYFPFNEVKIETKVRISIDGPSSLLIIEQTEFLNRSGEGWNEVEQRKIIIDESQYEDFAELLSLGLTFIEKSI
jgi:hypothetical protein